MPQSFYKKGNDVYETGVQNPITPEQFQGYGLNYNLLSSDPNNPTALDTGRDVETRSYLSQGGALGQPSAAQGAGFSFDPTTGQLVTPKGAGSFGGGTTPTTEAISNATRQLFNSGAVTTGTLPEDRTTAFKNLEARLKKSDDYVSQLMSLYTPTDKEKALQEEIDLTRGAAEKGINQEADRPATMGFITGAQASIERRANQKLAGLQREMTRLTGNREGQQKALTAAYDITKQSTQDAIEFYKLTAPDKIATDENTGTVYFHNPITGEVTSTKLPGFQGKEKQYQSGVVGEYQFATDHGYKGTFSQYQNEDANRKAKGSGSVSSGSPLVQAVLNNPELFNQLTPTQKGAIAPALAALGFNAFGKPLSDTAIKEINQSDFALTSLQDLKSIISSNEQYVGPISGLAAYNPYSKARQVQADIDRVKQTVGKALEGGVLRKEDEDKYKKILATITDTPATARYKLDALINSITKNIADYKALQGQSGRNVQTVTNPEDLRSKYNY